MAIEYPGQLVTFQAASDLSTKQFFPVKMSGAFVEACNTKTNYAIGVLQNTPSANQAATVMVAGISKIQASTTALTVGNLLSPCASGTARAVTRASGASNIIFGVCVFACSANAVGSVLLGAHPTANPAI